MGIELPIGLEIEIALHIGDWKQISDLRAYPDNLRFVLAQYEGSTCVCAELLVEIPSGTDLQLLRQELRYAPVEVPVGSVLIVGAET